MPSDVPTAARIIETTGSTPVMSRFLGSRPRSSETKVASRDSNGSGPSENSGGDGGTTFAAAAGEPTQTNSGGGVFSSV